MTSNIGSQEILAFQEKGGEYGQMKENVLGLLRRHFRPEFLNRVDEVIVFRALEQAELQQITGLLLERLAERLQKSAGFTLQWDDAAAAYLAEKGYDPSYGARPLKRLIQQEVETPLSHQIVKGEIKPGHSVKLGRGAGGVGV
jgi:ATP-dependent Clp protease ATP-binding subunit ClpB